MLKFQNIPRINVQNNLFYNVSGHSNLSFYEWSPIVDNKTIYKNLTRCYVGMSFTYQLGQYNQLMLAAYATETILATTGHLVMQLNYNTFYNMWSPFYHALGNDLEAYSSSTGMHLSVIYSPHYPGGTFDFNFNKVSTIGGMFNNYTLSRWASELA